MTLPAEVTHFQSATAEARKLDTLRPAEEAFADAALLALFKLRDALVARDANWLACQVDDVMSDFHRLARKAMR